MKNKNTDGLTQEMIDLATTTTLTDPLAEHAKKFAEAQAQEITPTTKVVKLQWRMCEGCNCSFSTLERTVPGDSSFKDGDKIYGQSALEDADELVS